MPRWTTLLLRSEEPCWHDVRTIVATMPQLHLLGEATSVEDARHLAARSAPDVLLASPRLAQSSTLPLLVDLRATVCATSRIILLATQVPPPTDLQTLTAAEITDYWLWGDFSTTTFRQCLELVLNSDITIASRTSVKAFLDAQRTHTRPAPHLARLTTRERVVLARLAEGHSYKEIAQREFLSLRTVERIVSNLEQKLDAPNHFVLALKAAQFGLLSK